MGEVLSFEKSQESGFAPRFTRNVDIIGAGLFEGESYELAASLNARPIIELIGHGYACGAPSTLEISSKVFFKPRYGKAGVKASAKSCKYLATCARSVIVSNPALWARANEMFFRV
jgi:hypothetical protein